MSKIRSDFVTNSSSSSFVLQKKKITDKQLEKILSHICSCGDYWEVKFGEESISGFTCMDNGRIDELFKKIRLNPKYYTVTED